MTSQDKTPLNRLAADVGACLSARGWFMGTAESCTGGWIAQAVTAIAGSSGWFEAGLVTYSNRAKIELLGVDPMVIEQHGAVSEQTAAAMAAGVVNRIGVDLAVSVTGVAGPGGGSVEKPVGTVCFGFAGRTFAPLAERQLFSGDRREVRAASVSFVLEQILERFD